MTNDFVTIKEASQITNKSDITIRRLIKHLLTHDKELFSKMIKQDRQGKNYIYLINKQQLIDYMTSHGYSDITVEDTDKNEESVIKNNQDKDSISALKDVIDIFRDQMNSKDKQINELIERNRESNILLKGMQDRLSLTDDKSKQAHQLHLPQTPSRERHNEQVYGMNSKVSDNKIKYALIAVGVVAISFLAFVIFASMAGYSISF